MFPMQHHEFGQRVEEYEQFVPVVLVRGFNER